jgi:acyl carrier protein
MIEPEDSTEIRLRLMLADIFQVPLEEITPDLAFGDLPQWDSLGHMELMMRLEEGFNAEITTESIAVLTSLPVIITYLQEHGYERS